MATKKLRLQKRLNPRQKRQLRKKAHSKGCNKKSSPQEIGSKKPVKKSAQQKLPAKKEATSTEKLKDYINVETRYY